jgi:hypothetical protein
MLAVLVELMLSGLELNLEQVDVNMFVSDKPDEQMLGELESGEVVVFLLTMQVEQLMHELMMDIEQVVWVVDDVADMVTENYFNDKQNQC